jgi:hypothetical protein
MGAQTRMVPRLVPVAVDTSAVMRNADATYPPPETAVTLPSQTRDCTRPLSARSVPRTPARSQAMTRTMTNGRLMPARMASL